MPNPQDGPYALDLSVRAGRVIRHRVGFPWSLGRPYAAEDWPGAYRLIPQASGAGLLSGDHIRQRITLGAQAQLRVESAGAMQVLAGRHGAARSDWHYELGPGAMLVLDAEPYALMPRAELDLRSDIRLAPGAILLAAEMMCPAHPSPDRSPATFGAWRAETRVADSSGGIHFIDRQTASRDCGARLAALPDPATAFGTIWVLADIAIATPAVADLPKPGCHMAHTELRAGAGMALRFAAVDGGALRDACRSTMAVLQSRLINAQAARSCVEPEMVAQT